MKLGSTEKQWMWHRLGTNQRGTAQDLICTRADEGDRVRGTTTHYLIRQVISYFWIIHVIFNINNLPLLCWDISPKSSKSSEETLKKTSDFRSYTTADHQGKRRSHEKKTGNAHYGKTHSGHLSPPEMSVSLRNEWLCCVSLAWVQLGDSAPLRVHDQHGNSPVNI